MSEYSWECFLLVPLMLTEDLLDNIHGSKHWHSWTERFNEYGDNSYDDLRRFFIAPIREQFFPIVDDKNYFRKTLDLDYLEEETIGFCGKDGKIASVLWIDLLAFDTFSFLLIKVSAEKKLSSDELLEINRKVPCWFKRHQDDNIENWQDTTRKTSLKKWIESHILRISESDSSSVFGDTDWFGHSLPMISFAGADDLQSASTDRVFVDLLTGAPPNNSAYALCDSENMRLMSEQTMQVYNDWVLGVLNNRILFYGAGSLGSPLSKNIEKHYIYVATIVYYQKLMLTMYLEKYIGSKLTKHYDEGNFGSSLREKLVNFRRNYVYGKLSSYSLGERIYHFISEKENIKNIVDRLSYEIESSDDYERLSLDKKEASLLNFIAIFASIFMPITTISSVFSVDDKYRNNIHSIYWLLVALLTLIFILSLFKINSRLKKR